MAASGQVITTTITCPRCDEPIPATIHLGTGGVARTLADRSLVMVAQIESIDTIDFEAHVLGCRGTDPL